MLCQILTANNKPPVKKYRSLPLRNGAPGLGWAGLGCGQGCMGASMYVHACAKFHLSRIKDDCHRVNSTGCVEEALD